MEVESPADAWYVWVGVAIASVGVAGVAAGLPAQPAPDATEAANTVDRVAASQYGASATLDHDADAVRIGTRQISLRNDGGSDHASTAVGSMTPVAESDGELYRAANRLLDGQPVSSVVAEHAFESERALGESLEEVQNRVDRDGATWQSAEGQFRVRAVPIGGRTVVLVAA